MGRLPAITVCGVLGGWGFALSQWPWLLARRTPLLSSLLANVVNFALDLVLMFGLGWGVAGAAAATAASQYVGIAAMLFLLARRGYFDPADLRHVPSLADIAPLLWVRLVFQGLGFSGLTEGPAPFHLPSALAASHALGGALLPVARLAIPGGGPSPGRCVSGTVVAGCGMSCRMMTDARAGVTPYVCVPQEYLGRPALACKPCHAGRDECGLWSSWSYKGHFPSDVVVTGAHEMHRLCATAFRNETGRETLLRPPGG